MKAKPTGAKGRNLPAKSRSLTNRNREPVTLRDTRGLAAITPREKLEWDDALHEALGLGASAPPPNPERVKEIMFEEARSLLGDDTPEFRSFKSRFLSSPTLSTLLHGDAIQRLQCFAVLLSLWGVLLKRLGDKRDIWATSRQLKHLGSAVDDLRDLGEIRAAREVKRVMEKFSVPREPVSGPLPSHQTQLILALENAMNFDGVAEFAHPHLAKDARRDLIAKIVTDFVSETELRAPQVGDILTDKRRRGVARATTKPSRKRDGSSA